MKIIGFIAALAFLFGPAAQAAKPSASESIKDANTRVRGLLSAKVEPGSEAERKNSARVTTELRDLFDIGDMAKRALVDHWDKMSATQRKDLVDTLRLIVERNYVSQLRSNLAYEIVYTGEEPKDGDVLVKTVIKAQRASRPVEIPVDYLLHPEGDHWRAFDVITDDVSILRNYRSQFNRIIAKEGVDGLIRRMKSKLERNED
jgi:phospholipid transport system substrate-binding protein